MFDDVLDAPSPTAGWSRRIISVRNAVVFPAEGSQLVQACGVQGPDGAYVHAASTWRGQRPLMVPGEAPAVAEEKLAGRHLWGGQLWMHFGHYMVESLARVWGFNHVEKPESIVFIMKRPGRAPVVRGYQRALLDQLGLDVPITIITQPTEVEELVIPGQGFGLGTMDVATPEFRRYFADHFARDIAPDGPERLYLSRSALGGAEGGLVLEDVLEKNLAAEGYEILHPQQHSIERQLAYYKAAKQVVGPDGSAFHLFGFVARPDQQAAVILRRNSTVYKGLKNQIHAFSGREPDVVEAVNADWVPAHKKRPGRFSYGQLDFEKVGRDLAAMGYVSAPERWDIPNFRRQKNAMAQFAAEKNTEYLRKKRRDKARAEAPAESDAA